MNVVGVKCATFFVHLFCFGFPPPLSGEVPDNKTVHDARCGEVYSLISLFRTAAYSNLPSRSFSDELRYPPSTNVWSAYTTIQGGLM